MYHIGGSTAVAKLVGGRCIGSRAQHGSLTFSPKDEASEWIRGGVCEVMHVYIEPSLIQQYAAENCGCSSAPEIKPFFAVHDPWLRSYFLMLRSEFEVFGAGGDRPDALLLTQSTELLVRHLVHWHSNLAPTSSKRAAPASPQALSPRHLSRVLSYIDANMTREITLADLAALAGVSRHHFIRSFRAATQRTPYAYLVERRLAHAVDALRYGTSSIEQIARESGFRSAPGFSNVFKKHIGMAPSEFRARAR